MGAKMKKLILNRKINRSDLFFSCLILIALILAGGNTANPDYNEYKYRYENLINDVHTGTLRYAFQFIFNKIGFSYQLFRFTEFIFCYSLLSRIITRYTERRILVISLYFAYPFLLDAVQIGNCIAYSIILYSIRFLDEEWPKGGIKYAIAVFIASQFHISAIAYILFLLVYVKKTKYLITYSILITLFFLNAINILPRYINKIPIIRSHAIQIGYYLSYNQSYKNGAVTYAFLISVCFILYYWKLSVVKKTNSELKGKIMSDTVTKILALELCFVPFILINSEFVRLVRNMWILYYMAFVTDIKDNSGGIDKRDKCFKAIGIVLALFLYYKELSPSSYYYEIVTKAIINNNIFW